MSSTDHKTSTKAVEKGQRIKELREKTELNRNAFARKHGIPIPTLKHWEYGFATGLTEKGAQKLVDAFASEGITTTKDWLLYGVSTKQEEPSIEDLLEEAHDELLFFYKKYPDAVHTIVSDDRMQPILRAGMIIAGRKINIEDREKYFSRLCIVGTYDNKVLFGSLMAGSKAGVLHLGYNNPDYRGEEVDLEVSKLLYIAPVCWVRMG